jgi:hypothetical protein
MSNKKLRNKFAHPSPLVETLAKNGVVVDDCKTYRGVWLDRGEFYLFRPPVVGVKPARHRSSIDKCVSRIRLGNTFMR